MIKEWSLEQHSPEEQDAFIDRIGSLLYKSIILRMTEADTLSKKDSDDLDLLMSQNETPDAAVVLDFLRGRVSNFDAIAAEESAKLKELFAAPTL